MNLHRYKYIDYHKCFLPYNFHTQQSNIPKQHFHQISELEVKLVLATGNMVLWLRTPAQEPDYCVRFLIIRLTSYVARVS